MASLTVQQVRTLQLGVQPQQAYDANGNPIMPASNPVPVDADVNHLILAELRGIRLALVVLACDGGRCKPQDFDPVPEGTLET